MATQPIDDPNALTAQTQPITKAPTAPSTSPLYPTAPVSAPMPLSGVGGLTAPTLGAGDAPPSPADTTASAYQPPPGSIPNTQTYAPGTSTPTSPGVLGYGAVPGTGGALQNLGGGQLAPTDNSGTGSMQILAPLLTQGYQAPGTVTAQGTIVGSTYDENGNPVPVYAGDSPNSTVQTTASQAPTTQQQQQLSQATTLGLVPPGGDGPGTAPAGYGVQASSLPGLLANAPAQPSAANGGGPATPASGGITSAPSGPASGVGAPSSGLGGLLAQLGSPAPGGSPGAGTPSSGLGAILAQLGAGQGGQANNGGVSLTPTTAENALTNQTISPGPATDRFAIANKQLQDTIKNVLDPQFAADQRSIQEGSFGAGRGVSGMNRTSLGNLDLARQNQINQLTSQTQGNALTGSIEDAYRNLGIAQQQQQFQNQQQQEGFGNAVTQAELNDNLLNSAFGRAAGQEQAGYANDPSQIALILSQIFGNQAGQAGSAASGLFNQQGQQSASSGNDALLQYLLSQLGQGSAQPQAGSVPAGAG